MLKQVQQDDFIIIKREVKMIIGIGVDVVEFQRMKTLLEKWNDIFLNKILTQKEIEYCVAKKNIVQHVAARFAAKEAVAKALSIGWSGSFRWKDVEITNDDSGKPSVVLHQELQKILSSKNIFLSLSHSESTIVAFVVIEG